MLALSAQMKNEGRISEYTIWAICIYLVGSAIYNLASLGSSWGQAQILLLLLAIGYQMLKIITGIALYFKKALTPYLALVILVWTLVATIQGLYTQPEASLNLYSVAYIVISLAILVAFVLYCFWLNKQGYYAEGTRA